jgi:D-galacturonate reductase
MAELQVRPLAGDFFIYFFHLSQKFIKNMATPTSSTSKVNVLLVGAGEYTTGFVHGAASSSDKKIGVVGLVMFDLRRRGIVDKIFIADVDGTRWPGIREHFQEKIERVYKDMDSTFVGYPADDVKEDFEAYLKAMNDMKEGGGLVVIFTPDNTHFKIAKAAMKRGLHVLVAKPAVQTLSDHIKLVSLAKTHGVLGAVEYHKRWDPCYADAKQKISKLGDFSFYYAFMSQPKSQLVTFQAWAGKASDISYYLNSHHIDIHCWALKGKARPIRVIGSAATGVAPKIVACPTCEDTISLTVEWENFGSGLSSNILPSSCSSTSFSSYLLFFS